MNQIKQGIQWLDDNKKFAYSSIRIFLGIILFIRGWLLFSDPGAITALVGEDKMYMWYSYIAIAHLLGGSLIAFGFVTRLGALIQIPVLFGAAFIVHNKHGLMMGGQSFELAVLVLFLLLIFLVFGSGALSMDAYYHNKRKK